MCKVVIDKIDRVCHKYGHQLFTILITFFLIVSIPIIVILAVVDFNIFSIADIDTSFNIINACVGIGVLIIAVISLEASTKALKEVKSDRHFNMLKDRVDLLYSVILERKYHFEKGLELPELDLLEIKKFAFLASDPIYIIIKKYINRYQKLNDTPGSKNEEGLFKPDDEFITLGKQLIEVVEKEIDETHKAFSIDEKIAKKLLAKE